MNTMQVRRYAGLALAAAAILGMSACGGSKPSEAEISKKLTAIYTETGLPKDQASKVADCSAPKFIKEVSSDGLNKVMDSKIEDLAKAKVSQEDQKAVSKISVECAEAVMN